MTAKAIEYGLEQKQSLSINSIMEWFLSPLIWATVTLTDHV